MNNLRVPEKKDHLWGSEKRFQSIDQSHEKSGKLPGPGSYAENQKWDQVGAQVSQFLESSEEFPALRAGKDLGLYQMVQDDIRDHYQRTGEVMPLKDAAGKAEAWLFDLVENVATQLGFKRDEAPRTLTNSDAASNTPVETDMLSFVQNPFRNRK